MLSPPNIRLNHISRCYILRALKLNKNHSIHIEVNKAISRVRDDIDYNLLPLKSESTIESLVKSIYNIIDLNTLEIIRHFYFPP